MNGAIGSQHNHENRSTHENSFQTVSQNEVGLILNYYDSSQTGRIGNKNTDHIKKTNRSFKRYVHYDKNSSNPSLTTRRGKSLSKDVSMGKIKFTTNSVEVPTAIKTLKVDILQLFAARWQDLKIKVNKRMYLNFLKSAQNFWTQLNLSFKDFGIGTESCKVIAKILRTYQYAHNDETSEFPKVQLAAKLDLSNNLIKDESFKFLIRPIWEHKRLVHVNLLNNDLTDDSFCSLFKFLQMNTTIMSLYLGNNNLKGKNKLKNRGWEALSRMLENNSVLQILDLQNIGLKEDTFCTIIKGRILSNS